MSQQLFFFSFKSVICIPFVVAFFFRIYSLSVPTTIVRWFLFYYYIFNSRLWHLKKLLFLSFYIVNVSHRNQLIFGLKSLFYFPYYYYIQLTTKYNTIYFFRYCAHFRDKCNFLFALSIDIRIFAYTYTHFATDYLFRGFFFFFRLQDFQFTEVENGCSRHSYIIYDVWTVNFVSNQY